MRSSLRSGNNENKFWHMRMWQLWRIGSNEGNIQYMMRPDCDQRDTVTTNTNFEYMRMWLFWRISNNDGEIQYMMRPDCDQRDTVTTNTNFEYMRMLLTWRIRNNDGEIWYMMRRESDHFWECDISWCDLLMILIQDITDPDTTTYNEMINKPSNETICTYDLTLDDIIDVTVPSRYT